MSPRVSSSQPQAYVQSGVDQRAADAFARRVRSLSVAMPRLPADGAFAAALPLPDGMRSPQVVATCDGIGSKVQLLLDHDCSTVAGSDLVAMCVNDLVCSKASPWFMLDYYGCAQLEPNCADAVATGIVQACEQAGCLLIGGETAQLPDLLHERALDLVGFAVGLVEQDELPKPDEIDTGDAVIGLLTEHLHCNGYSLVRKLLASGALTMQQRCGSGTLGEALLANAPLYSHLLDLARQHGIVPTALAHITGGGLPRNLPRMLPTGSGVRLQRSNWQLPALHRMLGDAGVAAEEVFNVFNHGVGMAWCIPAAQAGAAVQMLIAAGQPAAVIGTVTNTPGIELV